MPAEGDRASRIGKLNDQMRASGPVTPSRNRWLLTPGILALGPDKVATVVASVRTFSEFSQENDPYGEHDFGSIDAGGQQVFWKIDYYDRSLTAGSPDPADEAVTCRVLTIMLAMEY